MNISTDVVVSVLIGGAITAVVAAVVFGIQERRARRSFEVLARFLESFAANRGGSATVGFTRDAKGRITNANVTVTPEPGAAMWQGYAPTVTVTKTKSPPSGRPNDTESAEGEVS